jgi:hypothetical protein
MNTSTTKRQETSPDIPPPSDPWQDALERWATELQAECERLIAAAVREPSERLWQLLYGSLLAITAEPAEALLWKSWKMIQRANSLAATAGGVFCDGAGRYAGVGARNVHVHELTRPGLDLCDSIRQRRNPPPPTTTEVHKLQSLESLEKSGCAWEACVWALNLHVLAGRMLTRNEWLQVREGTHPTLRIPTEKTVTHKLKDWPDIPQRLHTTAWAVLVLAKALQVEIPEVHDLL